MKLLKSVVTFYIALSIAEGVYGNVGLPFFPTTPSEETQASPDSHDTKHFVRGSTITSVVNADSGYNVNPTNIMKDDKDKQVESLEHQPKDNRALKRKEQQGSGTMKCKKKCRKNNKLGGKRQCVKLCINKNKNGCKTKCKQVKDFKKRKICAKICRNKFSEVKPIKKPTGGGGGKKPTKKPTSTEATKKPVSSM